MALWDLAIAANPMLEALPEDLRSWDPTRPYAAERPSGDTWWNAGCPPEFFAQFVAKDQPFAIDYGNPNSGIRCARVATMTPEKLAYQSGISAWESMEHFNQALQQTGRDIVSTALPWGLLLGVGLLLWTVGGRR